MAGIIRLAALAAGLATGPAIAQEPICGGISLVGEWVGGAEGASDIATAEAPFDLSGEVPIAGHLVRMFTLSEPSDIRVEVAARPAGDPYVAIFDAGGAEVGGDDDSGGDFAARAEVSLAPGRYCLAARSYESGVTDVDIRLGRQDMAALTDAAPAAAPDEGPTTGGCGAPDLARLGDGLDAAALATGVSAMAALGQTPAWGFALAAPTTLTVTAESPTGDPVLTIRDAAGTVLAENDDFDGLNSRVDFEVPIGPGAFCVELDDLAGSENPITVSLRAYDAQAARQRRLDEAQIAPTSQDAVAVTELGSLDTILVADVPATGAASWFAFNLPEGGLVLTEALGDGLDPMVALFDRAGRRLGVSDDHADTLDSQLVARLMPGRYLVALRLVGSGGTGPVRLLMERFVPAQ